jgi:hypothetical protein
MLLIATQNSLSRVEGEDVSGVTRAIAGAEQGSPEFGLPKSDTHKEPSRADIEGAQTSKNLGGTRFVKAGSQAFYSAAVWNYGEPHVWNLVDKPPSSYDNPTPKFESKNRETR